MKRVVPFVLLTLLSAERTLAQGEDTSLPWRTSYFPYLTGAAGDEYHSDHERGTHDG